MLLFVTFFTVRNFYKLLFTAKTGVKFVTFLLFVTFFKLLFTVEKGQGLYCIHCARGERVPLDFYFYFYFFLLRGRGVEVNVFFSLSI